MKVYHVTCIHNWFNLKETLSSQTRTLVWIKTPIFCQITNNWNIGLETEALASFIADNYLIYTSETGISFDWLKWNSVFFHFWFQVKYYSENNKRLIHFYTCEVYGKTIGSFLPKDNPLRQVFYCVRLSLFLSIQNVDWMHIWLLIGNCIVINLSIFHFERVD